ncbi:hypothetical protein BO82DRAFT_433466 [Aspergillus uvarum CBS 121591]|uniref:DUF1365-domain-containing protein n=1 Tax=Aspergillus uvarum CBS 121591 TaxID=1448315 RepID=A0A319C2Q0_9EURO|nr:hypothetical protein BO82DRAFT_433466 [Aspergillus uvarum CBS 121591]PYH80276.1 hypothetical protein BO82DRAFT_433466 [Aspergillus uvarum CBS 121591]
MLYKDLVTLALYASLRHQNAAVLLTTLTALGALLLLTPCLILLFMLLRLFLVSHQVAPLSNEPQSIFGKPLLFPVQLNHVRLNPVKDQFANRFLMIGIPVGMRARYGNLLAIDDKRLTLHDSTHDGPSWRSFLAQATCWLTVDGERYLHRGDQDLDMRAKLDRYLLKENEDPSHWPYAYLLTVPRFFWWSRSVVSWWYLYNADRELDAMIMEINNSYDEKRNYFFRVERGETPIPALKKGNETDKPHFLDDASTIRSAPSQPKATYYKGTWQKFIFASPFEKVDGAIANRFMDLAHGAPWKPNATLLNTNTLSPQGKVKMVTRITCCGTPLDPAQMGFSDLARIVLRWTLPGVLTTPYIVLEALRIRWKGWMKMMEKTPVRSGSIGRHPTRAERQLEPFFRAYLAHCVSSSPEPMEVTYIPCRAFSDETIHMRSPYCSTESTSVRTVTIEVLDPPFYTRIANHFTAWEGLSTEMRATGQEADAGSQNIAVSDPTLLQKIVSFSPTLKDEHRPVSAGFPILKWCRWNSTPSFMDTFVASEQTPSTQKKYATLAVRYLLAPGVAYSPLIMDVLVDALLFIVGVMGRAGLLEVVLQQRRMTGLPMDVAAQTLMSAVVYFAGMRGVGVVRDRFLTGQA